VSNSTATVEVRVPSMLRAATSGQKVVLASGESIRQVLDDVANRYPGFADSLFGPDGELRQFVNVYVNDEDIRYLGKLDARLHDGDTVSILPAVAGGAWPSN
jgi:molybdopterin synthase sulfur carrier subunit